MDEIDGMYETDEIDEIHATEEIGERDEIDASDEVVGQMDRWVAGQMDGWMNGWLDGMNKLDQIKLDQIRFRLGCGNILQYGDRNAAYEVLR